MIRPLFVLGIAFAMSPAAHAQTCDCTLYPFRPNPPCFSLCVANLSTRPMADTAAVRNIDPGVSVGIGVLSQNRDKAAVDFGAIRNKRALEVEALKSLRGGAR
jgi:hypothetical protein